MKVVITGATSFIGAATVRRVLADGHEVCAVVRPKSIHLEHLWRMVPKEAGQRLLIIALDLIQIQKLPDILMEKILGNAADRFQPPVFDAWIHIGWDGAGSENRMKRQVQQSNVIQSLTAVRTAAALGCRRFLFTGSQAEYGVCHETIHEETPCRPVSEYGKAKADFCEQAQVLCRSCNIEYIHVRIFSIYGPGDHPWSLVCSCLRTWAEGGNMQFGACTQKWNFLYIDDAADALCHFLTEARSGIYNLAGKDTRPLRSYVEELYELCGRRGSFVYGERPQNAEGPTDLMPDISKILAETNWKPKITFAEGIRHMMENEYEW